MLGRWVPFFLKFEGFFSISDKDLLLTEIQQFFVLENLFVYVNEFEFLDQTKNLIYLKLNIDTLLCSFQRLTTFFT